MKNCKAEAEAEAEAEAVAVAEVALEDAAVYLAEAEFGAEEAAAVHPPSFQCQGYSRFHG